MVVADVADVQIINARLRAGPGGDVFPIIRRRSRDSPNTSAAPARVERINKRTVTGVVVSPINSGRRPRRRKAAALFDSLVFQTCELSRRPIVARRYIFCFL